MIFLVRPSFCTSMEVGHVKFDASNVIEENISFLKNLIVNHVVEMLPDRVRKDFLSEIESIERRWKRTDLTIGLIGGFSSGKSTLINALLGEEILPSGAVPTTASGTRITYGPSLQIILEGVQASNARPTLQQRFLKMLDAVKRFVTGIWRRNSSDGSMQSQPSSLWEGARQPAKGMLVFDVDLETARRMLTELTTHLRRDESSEDREPLPFHFLDGAVTISYPAPWLQQGIHIIDTPGLTASATDTDATLRIIRDEVDAALFLYPIDQAGTLGDLAVVREHLTRQAGQLVFVITKIDQVDDEDELDEVIEYLRDRIRTETNIADPLLFPISARSVFQPSERYNHEHFHEFADELVRFMERNRLVIIMGRTLQLQRRTLRTLGSQVTDLRTRYQQRLEELRRLAIEDLETFLSRQRPIVMEMLERENYTLDRNFSQFSGWLHEAAEEARRRLEAVLHQASNKGDLKRLVETQIVPIVLPDIQRDFNSIVQSGLNKIQRDGDKAVRNAFQEFESRFEKTYDLRSIGQNPVRADVLLENENWTADISSEQLQGLVGQMTSLFEIPLFGPLIDWLFGPSLEAVRKTIMDNFDLQLHSAIADLEGKLSSAIERMRRETIRATEATLRRYVETYAATVDHLIAEHQKKEAALQRDIAAIENSIKQIEERAANVERTIEQLQNRSVGLEEDEHESASDQIDSHQKQLALTEHMSERSIER